MMIIAVFSVVSIVMLRMMVRMMLGMMIGVMFARVVLAAVMFAVVFFMVLGVMLAPMVSAGMASAVPASASVHRRGKYCRPHKRGGQDISRNASEHDFPLRRRCGKSKE
ncbi:hypothetical protein [Lacipirellula parvula]|nr:hypothetical protein [Lacipirellula parvula]